jgi:hypothetical protein
MQGYEGGRAFSLLLRAEHFVASAWPRARPAGVYGHGHGEGYAYGIGYAYGLPPPPGKQSRAGNVAGQPTTKGIKGYFVNNK